MKSNTIRTSALILFMLMFVLATGLVSLFAEGQGEEGVKKLRMLVLKTYVEDINTTFDSNVAEWAAMNNVEVEIDRYTFDEMEVKFATAVETGDTPDIAELEQVGPARYHGMGQLLDVTDLFNEVVDQNGAIPPEMDGAIKFGGKYYAVPHTYLPRLLNARQDIVDEAGIAMPTTWDELEQASIKIKNAGIMEYPLGYSWNYSTDGYEPFLAQLYGRDASFCTTDGGFKAMWGQKGAEDTIRWCTDIYNKSKVVPPDALAWKGFTNNENFLEGSIAFTSNGNSIWWALEQRDDPLLEKTWVGQMPGGPARRVNVSLGLYFSIFRNSKNPELAKDLIKYLLSEEPYTRLMESGSAQNVPVYHNYMDMEYYQQNPTYKRVLETAEAAVAMGWPGPMTPAAAEVVASQALMDMLQRIITEQVSFEEGVKETDNKIKTIYDILQK